MCVLWVGGIFPAAQDPDYSAAQVLLETDAEDGVKESGITFTLGKGTEVVELNTLLRFHNA